MMANSEKDDDSSQFPTILSDEEIEAGLKRRAQNLHDSVRATDHPEHERPLPKDDGRPESTIEQRFPHIAKMLVAMWPSEAFIVFAQRMVVADRETRAGFPNDVIEDLMMLNSINDLLLRKLAPRRAATGTINTATDRGARKPPFG